MTTDRTPNVPSGVRVFIADVDVTERVRIVLRKRRDKGSS
jgi:hypothetical protein